MIDRTLIADETAPRLAVLAILGTLMVFASISTGSASGWG